MLSTASTLVVASVSITQHSSKYFNVFIDTPILDGISSGSNRSSRETLKEAGFEISPVELVAEAAWTAIEGKKVHTLVGKTAGQLAFLARFVPGMIRKRAKRLQDARV